MSVWVPSRYLSSVYVCSSVCLLLLCLLRQCCVLFCTNVRPLFTWFTVKYRISDGSRDSVSARFRCKTLNLSHSREMEPGNNHSLDPQHAEHDYTIVSRRILLWRNKKLPTFILLGYFTSKKKHHTTLAWNKLKQIMFFFWISLFHKLINLDVSGLAIWTGVFTRVSLSK